MYVGLRMLLNKSRLSVKQFAWIYLASLLGIGLLYLGATGRLHPLFALLGVVLPFAMRLLGRGVQAASLYQALHRTRGKAAQGAASQDTSSTEDGPTMSEISTRYIHMILVHETGRMDGIVLGGSYLRSRLSKMGLKQLMALLQECQDDPDSCNLLITYLDRERPGWQSHSPGTENSYQNTTDEQTSSDQEMTRAQALDILGLPANATPEDIVNAHRRLIQKIHPDRGGSTWLATKINAAKELLMRYQSKPG